jgi:hypothetical protein
MAAENMIGVILNWANPRMRWDGGGYKKTILARTKSLHHNGRLCQFDCLFILNPLK